MDPSQMQTPPPTRDASSRRKQYANIAAQQTPNMPTSNVASTPLTTIPLDQSFMQTPGQYSHLQFSPGASAFGQNVGLTSPLFTSQPNIWDQSPVQMAPSGPFMSNIDNPFGAYANPDNGHLSWQFASPQMQPPMSSKAPQFIFRELDYGTNQGVGFMSSSPGPSPAKSTISNQEPLSANGSVDPSMIFGFNGSTGASFSMGGLSLDNNPSQSSVPSQRTANAPQRRESREMDDAMSTARSLHSRTNTASSGGSVPPRTIRPSMTRSKTDSGFRREPASSLYAQPEARVSAENLPRRMSPLKRSSGSKQLTSIPEAKTRPRTRLVIDEESGIARTVTDSLISSASEDRKALKSQYPGLWADDDSSSDDERRPPARSNSFAFATQPRPVSKHARDDSFGRASSVKKSRPTSFFSLQKAFEKPTEQELSESRRTKRSSFGGYSAAPQDPPSYGTADTLGGAQDALKRVVEGRHKKQEEKSAQNTLQAHNKRWSQAAADMAVMGNYFDPFTSSPTNTLPFDSTLDIPTPSTGGSSASGDSIRCVCHSNVDAEGDTFVECESCKKWLHCRCVGLDPVTAQQNVYLCVFCTGSTPIVRNGRVRNPARAPPQPDQSPLTHKTIHRR